MNTSNIHGPSDEYFVAPTEILTMLEEVDEITERFFDTKGCDERKIDSAFEVSPIQEGWDLPFDDPFDMIRLRENLQSFRSSPSTSPTEASSEIIFPERLAEISGDSRKEKLERLGEISDDNFKAQSINIVKLLVDGWKSCQTNEGDTLEFGSELEAIRCIDGMQGNLKSQEVRIHWLESRLESDFIKTCQSDIDDGPGFHWRKYGEKVPKDCVHPRQYYRCTTKPGCPARKTVELNNRGDSTEIKYKHRHNHPPPSQSSAVPLHQQGPGASISNESNGSPKKRASPNVNNASDYEDIQAQKKRGCKKSWSAPNVTQDFLID